MEENQKKIEQIAGEKNIDSGNAMYDDTTRELIDLEDLLMQDSPVAYRINNLMKNGVSLEQVKNVYEAIAAGGNSVEQALNELDKVFFVLAKTITDSPNEIVIDLFTGNIDHKETRKRIIELGLTDDYFEYTSKLKPMFAKSDTQATLDDFIEVLTGKKETDSNSFIKHMEMFDQYKSFADDIKRIPMGLQNRILETDLSGIDGEIEEDFENDDIQDPNDITEENDRNIPEKHYKQTVEFSDDGITYGEKKVSAQTMLALEAKANESSIETLEDVDAFKALFSYARDVSRMENTAKSIKSIKSALPKVSSRYAHMFENILDENGNVNEEELFKVVEEFQHSRNEGSVAKNLFKILRGDKTHKADVLKTLARSFLHEDDNPEIIAAAKAVAEANGIEYTREGIQKEVYKVMNISFDSYEAFEAFAVGKELSIYTFEGKFNSIEKSIIRESDKDVQDNSRLTNSYRNDFKKARKQDPKEKLLGEAFSYVVDEHSKIDESTGLNFKGHEVIAALKYFVENNPHKDKNRSTLEIRMIKNYLVANREEFTNYFMTYTDIDPYHKNNGYVDMDAINEILAISPLPERSKENVEKMISATQISAKVIDKKSKLDIVTSIEKIYKETIGVNKEPDEDQIETVKKLMGRLNFSKLTPEFINAVGQMHPELEDFVEKRNEDMKKAEQARNEVSGKQTKQNAIFESVELLEAKLNIFSGTPYYGKILAERKKFYENNPKAEEYRSTLYSVDGSLNVVGNRQVKKYIEDYRDKKILDHVKGVDYRQLQGKEKENFTKWLLVGLSSKNSTVAEFAANYLKEMNPELYSAPDQFMFKEMAYKTVYPDIKSLDEIWEKEEVLKKNLTRLVFKESVVYTEERISDLNFREFYERHAELFDATATNLDLGEMQNYYLESEIKFTEQDEKAFHDLYEQSTIDSWLSTKNDASKMTLVTLYELKQRALKTKKEERIGSRNPEFIQQKIDRFLEKHPKIKEEYVDENGNIDRKLINQGRRFINDKVTSDILKGFSRTVFGNVQDYDDVDLRQQTTKHAYLSVLVALQHAETIKDPNEKDMLKKLAYRALEMMNTDERKMIEFDRNGNPKLNEKEILKTFQDQKHSYETLDELKAAKYEQYKHVFMYKKMSEYDRKTEKDFFELESEEPEDQIAEIERIKRSQKAKYKADSEKKKNAAQIKEEKKARKREKKKINKAKNKDGVNSKRYKTSKSKAKRAKARVAQIENNRINQINNKYKQAKQGKQSIEEIFAAQKMQIESDEKISVNVVNTERSVQSKKSTENGEVADGVIVEKNVSQSTQVANDTNTVARENINNQTQAVEQRDGKTSIEDLGNLIQAEEVVVAENKEPEENKKDFFKPLKDWWKRITTPRLGDGKEATKKPGFFAKLFGKKEEPKVEENETNDNKKENVIQNGLSHIVLDNKDGKYDVSPSGNNKSQDSGKVLNGQEQEEYGELG